MNIFIIDDDYSWFNTVINKYTNTINNTYTNTINHTYIKSKNIIKKNILYGYPYMKYFYVRFNEIPIIRLSSKQIIKTLKYNKVFYPIGSQIKIKQPVAKMGYKRGQRKEKYETNKNNMGI